MPYCLQLEGRYNTYQGLTSLLFERFNVIENLGKHFSISVLRGDKSLALEIIDEIRSCDEWADFVKENPRMEDSGEHKHQ